MLEPTNQVNKPMHPKIYYRRALIIIGFIVLAFGAYMIYIAFFDMRTSTGNDSDISVLPSTLLSSEDVLNNLNFRPKSKLLVVRETDEDSVVLVENGKDIHTFITYPYRTEDLLFSPFSPNRKFAILKHSKYGTHKNTGLFLIKTTYPYEITELIKPSLEIYSQITWSPDSNYVSCIIDEGKELRIFSVLNNQVVLSIKPATNNGLVGGLTWENDSYFTYIIDGMIYKGVLDNPKEKLLASDADGGGLSGYSSAPLEWSVDKRYVSYFSREYLVVLDTQTGKKYYLAARKDYENYDEPFTSDITPIGLGWRENKYFLLEDKSTVKYINFPSEEIKTYDLIADSDGFDNVELSNDGYYATLYNYAYSFYRFYNLNNYNAYCQIDVNPGLDKLFLNNRDHSWEESGYALLEKRKYSGAKEYSIMVVDINECKVLGLLEGDWPEYGQVLNTNEMPSVIDFVNVVKDGGYSKDGSGETIKKVEIEKDNGENSSRISDNTVTNDKSIWLTYENKKYGFKIKYPKLEGCGVSVFDDNNVDFFRIRLSIVEFNSSLNDYFNNTFDNSFYDIETIRELKTKNRNSLHVVYRDKITAKYGEEMYIQDGNSIIVFTFFGNSECNEAYYFSQIISTLEFSD